MIRPLAVLLGLAAAMTAVAQPAGPPNAILLIARPELADPNFRETVVLVTQAPDASTVGVILNRPTGRKHSKSGQPMHVGGPVMPGVTIALFRSVQPPGAPAFAVLKDVYLSMHPGNIEPLYGGPASRYRLFAGFSGWAPGQLQSEMMRESWYMLPASQEVIFRADTAQMWRELVEKARKMNVPKAFAPRQPSGVGSFAILSRCRNCVFSSPRC